MSTYPSSNLGQPSSRGGMSSEVNQDSSRNQVSFNFGAGYLSDLDAEDSSFPRHNRTDWPYNFDPLTSGNYIQPNWNEGFIQGHNELVIRSQTHMVIGEGGTTSSREILLPQERISGFVPACRKNNPFTIEEVEGLVQAVERLGPGSWKMIKDEVLLFRNDSRRTPTDLKDKWRTLVKTANLPADRRRSGAEIPEPLLQRVLNAQNPIFHQQAMQQYSWS